MTNKNKIQLILTVATFFLVALIGPLKVFAYCSMGAATACGGHWCSSWSCDGGTSGTWCDNYPSPGISKPACFNCEKPSDPPTPVPEDGVCGKAGSKAFKKAPSSDLCKSGKASSVSGSGPWTWDCNGKNGSTINVSCSASVLIPLTASCRVTPVDKAWKDGPVTWIAEPHNGALVYSFSWKGTDSLSGDKSSVTKKYKKVGDKYATTTIKSGSEKLVVACPKINIFEPGTETVDPGDGGGDNSTGDINKVGECGYDYDELVYSAPKENTRCLKGDQQSFGEITSGWAWTCGSGSGEKICTVLFNTQSDDPSLDCSISMKPQTFPKVNINVNTIWEATSTYMTGTVRWKIVDDNNPDPEWISGDYTLNRIFSTTGLKTIIAQIASTTPDVYGDECKAETTIVQEGGWTREI